MKKHLLTIALILIPYLQSYAQIIFENDYSAAIMTAKNNPHIKESAILSPIFQSTCQKVTKKSLALDLTIVRQEMS